MEKTNNKIDNKGEKELLENILLPKDNNKVTIIT